MKLVSFVAIILLLCLFVPLIWLHFQERPTWPLMATLPTKPFLDGDLPIPEKEFKPVVDQAVEERGRRNEAAENRQCWADWIFYASLPLGIILALIPLLMAAFSDKPGENQAEIKDIVLKGQVKSKRLAIALAVLVGFSQVPNLLLQQFRTEATRFEKSASELNNLLVSSVAKLYDPETTKGQAKAAVEQLRGAIGKR